MASRRMRSTMERKPFERCGVRWSRSPSFSNSAMASVERMFFRVLAGVQREQHRDQPAHDMGVAVAVESQHRTVAAIRLDGRREPHLAGAAPHLVGVVAGGFRQRRQRAAKLDQIAVAVVPLLQQLEILNDLVDRRLFHALYIGWTGRCRSKKNGARRRRKPRGKSSLAVRSLARQRNVFRAGRRALPNGVEVTGFQRALRTRGRRDGADRRGELKA